MNPEATSGFIFKCFWGFQKVLFKESAEIVYIRKSAKRGYFTDG